MQTEIKPMIYGHGVPTEEKWWLEGAIQRQTRLSPSSRKVSRMTTKGGKELLKCKEKYGNEHKSLWDLFLKRQPHHKQCTSNCALMHWWGMVVKPQHLHAFYILAKFMLREQKLSLSSLASPQPNDCLWYKCPYSCSLKVHTNFGTNLKNYNNSTSLNLLVFQLLNLKEKWDLTGP